MNQLILSIGMENNKQGGIDKPKNNCSINAIDIFCLVIIAKKKDNIKCKMEAIFSNG